MYDICSVRSAISMQYKYQIRYDENNGTAAHRPTTHSPVVFPAPRKPERTVTGSGGGGVHDALLASLLVLVLVVLLVVDNFSNAPLTMSIGPSCWPCMIGTVLARGRSYSTRG
jgi:uncharacterized integral membrane protein